MGPIRIALALLALVVAEAVAAPSVASPGNYGKREDVHQFIAEMVERHGFVARELRTLFGRARYQPAIIRAMTPPPEAPVKSWQAYRALFVSRERIEAGARFRERYDRALARAAQDFGVPAEIIVAIIGVETVYGRNMGAYRMIDALATLSFDFPRRSEFFRSELESFLLYARESGIDVFAAQGSYAGAFGIPQFMPGSYRRFAVDYDGDGRRDLHSSPVDAIGSVANFLRAHGWEAGRPIAAPAQVSGESFRTLIDAGIKPVYRLADLPAYGVAVRMGQMVGEAQMVVDAPVGGFATVVGFAEALPPETACALVELETPGQASEYWVGLQNFYALTRYNRSSFYAIAVFELAREIVQAAR